MLMEVETAKEHLKDSDPVAVRWLEKIEQLVMEQAQLVFQARRDLREDIQCSEPARSALSGGSGRREGTKVTAT